MLQLVSNNVIAGIRTAAIAYLNPCRMSFSKRTAVIIHKMIGNVRIT